MASEPGAWAAALSLPAEQEAEFVQLAAAMSLKPAEVLCAMMGRAAS